MEGRMEGWKEGRKDRRKEGRKEGRRVNDVKSRPAVQHDKMTRNVSCGLFFQLICP